MKLWYAMVASLDVAFDPVQHCLPDGAGFSMRISEVEAQLATIEIEREQRGWRILGKTQPRNILVSWSPTGSPADAVLLARGRINELPSDLLADRQTIRAVCAPVDMDDKLLAWAKANKTDGPWTDLLFSDFDEEDPESYLLGRSETYCVDAATHQVSTIDDLDGDRTWDLSDVVLFEGGSVSDAPGIHEPPAKRLKANLTVEWTQTASGTCNIGPFIGIAGSVSSLDPSFGSNLGQFLSAEGTDGWSLGATDVKVGRRLAETTQFVSSYYRAFITIAFREFTKVEKDGQETVKPMWSSAPAVEGAEDQGGPYKMTSPSVVYQVFDYQLRRFELKYSYNQPRREILRAVLDVPVQDGIVVDEEDPDPIELALRSPFEDPGIPEWKVETEYKVGDLVYHDGKAWRCNGDHIAVYFDQRRDPPILKPISSGFVRFVQTIAIYWERHYPKDLPDAETMVSFLDTTRGQTAVEHVWCRLRKAARRRMRARHLTFSCRWQDGVHVRMSDSVSITVPWGDGSARLVTGKVVARELLWSGDAQPRVTIEIAVSFGDGSVDDRSPSGGGYVENGYVRPGYVALAGARPLDVLHLEEADVEPVVDVDVARLHQGSYALISSRVHNVANEQISQAESVVRSGEDPTQVSVVHPTYIDLRLRSLAGGGELVRVFDGAGLLLNGPQGVDLG